MKIVLIGSGNVASHLGKAISSLKGYPVAQVYSKTKTNAKKLADKINCAHTTKVSDIIPNADLYLIAIEDDQIINVAGQLKSHIKPSSLVVHTSGGMHSTILAPFFKNHGVLYPLQTFTKSKKMVYNNIPFLVVGSSGKNIQILTVLANQISKTVQISNDKLKSTIHLAAVFVNNFPNALFDIAARILGHEKIPFRILNPKDAQTGPAKRNDKSILARHRAILKTYPGNWLKIYNEITSAIISLHHK
jgi:predicted short-subunit dehydrogenase-like oxidoreductase (DUF2520 family)